jgi:hypothetical protein
VREQRAAHAQRAVEPARTVDIEVGRDDAPGGEVDLGFAARRHVGGEPHATSLKPVSVPSMDNVPSRRPAPRSPGARNVRWIPSYAAAQAIRATLRSRTVERSPCPGSTAGVGANGERRGKRARRSG